MPKSRRARLTSRKIHKLENPTSVPLGREKNAPTEAQWQKMGTYNGFEVQDNQGEEYKFNVGDLALVWPNGRRLSDSVAMAEHWMCRILDVRATAATNVWAKVEWLYSEKEAKEKVPTFDGSHLGKFEKIESNHADCLSSSVFNGKIILKKFDESDLDPEPILDGEFFFRYSLDVKTNTISPSPISTCTCGHPYDPSDDDPGSLMHFCPRPPCRKYYHSRCIAGKGASPAAERDRGFLLLDPDSDDRIELNEGSASAPPPKKKRRQSRGGTGRPIPVVGLAATDIFAHLPPALVEAAAQPIVRGAAFAAGGVVGNVSAVLKARRLVFHGLRSKEAVDEQWEDAMPDRWKELVDVKLVEGKPKRPSKRRESCSGKGKAKEYDSREVLALSCPECGGSI